ncbi:OLC1v1005981C1 [Oldenlandia corymbosa var. corymbosa]|uniref:OLC1v1005981C1 n=1 Tax=Oldenlandia corymbosa var. corymbosa TaxID=529605 RepID=A0AAV1DFV0_OLDCO|nr:OLC1v1005981C1 [Oldenlandia corymbosa var. corymbosa]
MEQTKGKLLGNATDTLEVEGDDADPIYDSDGEGAEVVPGDVGLEFVSMLNNDHNPWETCVDWPTPPGFDDYSDDDDGGWDESACATNTGVNLLNGDDDSASFAALNGDNDSASVSSSIDVVATAGDACLVAKELQIFSDDAVAEA